MGGQFEVFDLPPLSGLCRTEAIAKHRIHIGALPGRISLDDGTGDQGVTTDLLDHPLNGLARLARSAEAAASGDLKAGHVVVLGSVTPPAWLTEPPTVTIRSPTLPAVTVRFR